MILNEQFSKLRNTIGLKFSYGLRAFVLYAMILGGLGWFILNHAIERLNDGMRQSAESIMVDSANILASILEQQLTHESENSVSIDTNLLARSLQGAKSRQLDAQIYQVSRRNFGADVYVTDRSGMVIYDSSGKNLGQDFSNWRDVYLTLSGKYGARTSFLNSQGAKAQDGDPKAMIVAAPIHFNNSIVGSISLLTPIEHLNAHLETETLEMQKGMYLSLAVAVIIGFLLSLLFSRSMVKIATYANSMAKGEPLPKPHFLDQRLSDLSDSVENLRSELDGKNYVENYIHGLTHELKTPITGIQGSVELLKEDLSEEQRDRFINNIELSNQRMSRLVQRMLDLAKLENRNLVYNNLHSFNLEALIQEVADQYKQFCDERKLTLQVNGLARESSRGDRDLIYQAISNLLDNAIKFSAQDSPIELHFGTGTEGAFVHVQNQGELIPDFAHERLFERFFSLPSQQKGNNITKSTGLGLSFVKQIMKLHNGTVEIENLENGVLAKIKW